MPLCRFAAVESLAGMSRRRGRAGWDVEYPLGQSVNTRVPKASGLGGRREQRKTSNRDTLCPVTPGTGCIKSNFKRGAVGVSKESRSLQRQTLGCREARGRESPATSTRECRGLIQFEHLV